MDESRTNVLQVYERGELNYFDSGEGLPWSLATDAGEEEKADV